MLPLRPAVPALVHALDLPTSPADVAAATLAGRERRLDLLRNDAGSVTLHGCLLGGLDHGKPAAFRARIEVDDTVLTDGDESVLACAVRNAGASDVDGLPLVTRRWRRRRTGRGRDRGADPAAAADPASRRAGRGTAGAGTGDERDSS